MSVIKDLKTTQTNNFSWQYSIFITFLLLFTYATGIGASLNNDQQTAKIKITVDPRVELFSTIFRLAGNPEYNKNHVPVYVKKIKKYFASFAKHDAVKLAARLKITRGIRYNAPASLAVHVVDATSLQERIPLKPLPDDLDSRWNTRISRKFLEVARKFARDTKFDQFIASQQDLYTLAIKRMDKMLQANQVLPWFEQFFGKSPDTNFILALGMQNGGYCYAASCKDKKGNEEIYCVLGVYFADEEGLPRFDQEVLPVIIHEFCHSYINPLVDRHKKNLKSAAQTIYAEVKREMKQLAYSSWESLMYESLVRACVIRYLQTHQGEAAAQKQLMDDQKKSFFWVGLLAKQLQEYEQNRQKYPDLNSFFPRIYDFFTDYAQNVKSNIQK